MQQPTEKDTSVDCLLLQKHRNMDEILCREKKKRPDTKSIFEYLKKNELTDTSEKQVEYPNQMINLNLIFNKKIDQGLDSFYKTTEKDDEIPLGLSHIT